VSEPPFLAYPAPAKINLFLHVTGRRPDGYHELQTLFQLLDWGDEVRLRKRNDAAIVRVNARYDVAPEEDLVIRAARLLQDRTACGMGADIEVIKRVPMGSGLGGGSSDAATVLLVLNQIWNCGLDGEELASLGLQLGADVPVFVQGASALATGVGEELRAVELGERHYLLVFPGIGISTAEVFSDPLLPRNSPRLDPDEVQGDAGRNDCEEVVLRRYPAIAETMRELGLWGRPRMTGTGSGIFLPMIDKNAAQTAATKLNCRYNVRAVRGVDISPLHERLGLTPAGARP
jgi:4-diphosphocytidyl-2-C-methyl-D-erythritol kinase